MQDFDVWRFLLEILFAIFVKIYKNQNTSKISRLNYYFFCLSKHVSFRTVLVNCEWNRVDFLINL